ncbi:MAG: GTP-binding protein, partial [Selenomonadaceae bacterium]|nr:GTP-binding protein [Selenomonadaceae bacterium]
MKEYTTENIRNVAVVGHGKTGKTSLLEACLFNSGATKRLGKVDDGTGVLDYEQEEEKRKMTISDSLAVTEWKNAKINFIDTPGYPDFVGEVLGGLAAADSALIILSAPSGVEVETEKAFALADEMNLPRAFFINKMDREHANFHKCIDDLQAKFGNKVVPVQIPIGAEASFKGIIDLTNRGDVPADLSDEVEEAHMQMVDFAAEGDEEIMEKYLEEGELTDAEIIKGLIGAIKNCDIFPVFVGSALQNVSIKELLDAVVDKLPAPNTKTYTGINPKNDEPIERKVT